jgi:hypothetical protein
MTAAPTAVTKLIALPPTRAYASPSPTENTTIKFGHRWLREPICAPACKAKGAGKAFVTTCEALGLTDHSDAMTELVAEKIIELAQRGFKNAFALHVAAMQEFESDAQ